MQFKWNLVLTNLYIPTPPLHMSSDFLFDDNSSKSQYQLWDGYAFHKYLSNILTWRSKH